MLKVVAMKSMGYFFQYRFWFAWCPVSTEGDWAEALAHKARANG
jgi:hypothetical protein